MNDKVPERSSSRVILGLQIAYLVLITLVCIWNQVFPSPELLLIAVVTALVWRAKRRSLLFDLIPFLLLLLSYQALRNVADDLSPMSINIENLIRWERALFNGVVPASFLQKTLTGRPFTPVLNIVTNVFYMSHFVVPVIFGMLLWNRSRNDYWLFVLGLMVLSYAAFVTYVLFPAAPPWWATKYGYLQEGPVMLTNFVFPSLALTVSPNPVAAMPSLHAAYPIYIALYATGVWRGRGMWTWFLPLGVAFSAIYLGHHYVIDILAGALYAVLIYIGLQKWARRQAHQPEAVPRHG